MLTMRQTDLESMARTWGQFRGLVDVLPNLADAYWMLEHLRQIYDANNRREAEQKLHEIRSRMSEHLKKIACGHFDYLFRRLDEVLGYFEVVERGFEKYGPEARISATTSPTEGANNKLKELRADNRGWSTAALDALVVITSGYAAQVEIRDNKPHPVRRPKRASPNGAGTGAAKSNFKFMAAEIAETLIDDVWAGRLDKKKKPTVRKDVPTDEDEYDDSMEIAA